jgi:hypothetical protein
MAGAVLMGKIDMSSLIGELNGSMAGDDTDSLFLYYSLKIAAVCYFLTFLRAAGCNSSPLSNGGFFTPALEVSRSGTGPRIA